MKVKNLKELHKVVCSNKLCEVCNIAFPENMLCAHHVKTRKSRPDLALETKNCICVCNTPSEANKNAGCHNAIHMGLIKATDKL